MKSARPLADPGHELDNLQYIACRAGVNAGDFWGTLAHSSKHPPKV